MEIFPSNALAIIVEFFMAVLQGNVHAILGVLAFALGLVWIKSLFNAAKEGRFEREEQEKYDSWLRDRLDGDY